MNSDILKGRWKQVRGEIKATWGKLTDDHLDVIAGDAEKLMGKVQELYGESRDKVRASLNTLLERFDKDTPEPRRKIG